MANPEHLKIFKQGVEQSNILGCRRKLRALAIHFVGLSLLLSSCNKPPQQTSSATASGASTPCASALPTTPTGAPTKVLMHNVILIERPGFQLRVRWLRGQMRRTHSDVVPSFDEPNSFVLDIEAGVIATSLSEISALLNGELLKNTPLKNVSLADEGKQLRLNGTLHKGIPLPIEMTSEVSAVPDGRIRLHVVKMRVLKLPVTGLLQSFHVKVGDLVGAKGAEGVQVADDDICINPERILPSPAIRGSLTDALIGSKTGDLITIFGNARPEVAQVKEWRNFIRLSGGSLNFGKLTMHQTDLILIDDSQDEWFDFDLSHYQEQLVNGRFQMTPEAGLRIFMPDIDKIPRTAANALINPQWMKNRNLPPPDEVTH
ncbi:MAG: hypothetical protein ACLPND_03825 [Candidatus Korobacteraceae bacterium]